jgi:hypothetical protein
MTSTLSARIRSLKVRRANLLAILQDAASRSDLAVECRRSIDRYNAEIDRLNAILKRAASDDGFALARVADAPNRNTERQARQAAAERGRRAGR